MKKAITLKNLKIKIKEQFRSLRTNIVFSLINNEIKSIVVTSCLPSEGKSTVISNLAVAMASSGRRVVIVDCDLRKPTIHKRFSISNYKRLTNILTQDGKIEDIVITSSIPNLYILPCGPIQPNSSELLGSKKMKIILKELTTSFDVVLIDTPPILYLSDAQILAALSQGSIIVAAYGKSEKDDLLSAKDMIEKVGGKILGVVINKIPNSNTHKYCYNYRC